MPLNTVYVAGVIDDTAGNALNVTPPQLPITFTKDIQFQGAATSTAAGSYAETANTRMVWTADAASAIIAVLERHSVVGSTTGMLVKATGSTPLGSGLNVLSSTLPMTAAVDVFNSGTIFNSTTLTQMAIGDAIGIRWTTPGNLAPVGGVTVVLQRI